MGTENIGQGSAVFNSGEEIVEEPNEEVTDETNEETEGGESQNEETADGTEEVEEELTYEEALARLKESQAAIKKQDEALKQKEEFIQRQKTEVGKAREVQQKYNQTLSELEKAKAELDKMKDDPSVDIDQYADAKHRVQKVESEAQLYSSSIAEGQVLGLFPDFIDLLEKEIPAIMKAEGYNDIQVAQMKQNWRLDPNFSIQYGQKAKLYQENVKLKEELSRSKKVANGGVEQIVNAPRLAPGVRGTSGSALKPVESMTAEEKRAEYARLVKLGKVTPR